MPMRLVKRHAKDQKPDVLRLLSEDESATLRRYWVEDNDSRTEQLLAEVGRILADAHRLGAWIQCDCSDGALLATAEYRPGKFKLIRMPKRDTHPDHCPFHWEEGELAVGQGKERKLDNKPKLLPEHMDFLLLDSKTETAAKNKVPDEQQGKRRLHREPTYALQRPLFWLLNKAGLNVLDGGSLERKARQDKLTAVLDQVEIVKDVKLGRVTFLSLKAITEGWMQERFDKNRWRWPQDKPMQGYLILTGDVDSESRQVRENSGQSLQIDGSLAVYGRDGESTGPYVVIVAMAETEGRLQSIRAYAHPLRLDFFKNGVRYTDYLPVDSGFERDAAVVLKNFAARINSQEPGRMRIVKPLEDFDVEGAGCRPDFVVEDTMAQRQCVIETMGSLEQEYRERKESTHRLMQTLGTLILDERAGVERKVADARLETALWRWFKASY